MFIYTIIIILLIIPIIIIMIIPQDQGSAWRHSRGQLLLQRLSRQRFTEGREDIAAMPLGTFANLRDGYTAVQNGPSLGIQTSNMNIYYMNHWGMSSETRKKKVQETKQMHTNVPCRELVAACLARRRNVAGNVFLKRFVLSSSVLGDPNGVMILREEHNSCKSVKLLTMFALT